jgi:hypothetical protein
MDYSIAHVERAINIWRERRTTGEDGALCGEARALATPYTMMFLDKRETIAASTLTAEQQRLMKEALGF